MLIFQSDPTLRQSITYLPSTSLEGGFLRDINYRKPKVRACRNCFLPSSLYCISTTDRVSVRRHKISVFHVKVGPSRGVALCLSPRPESPPAFVSAPLLGRTLRRN